MILILLLILHVIVAIMLVGSILIQSSKGGGLSGSIGGFGMGQSLFGSAGTATFLTKATSAFAILFFVTTLSIGYLYSKGKGMDNKTVNIFQQGLMREQKEMQERKKATSKADVKNLPTTKSSVPEKNLPTMKGTGKKAKPAGK